MEYYDINEFMGSIDKDRKLLEDLVFDKVKESISLKTDKAFLFTVSSLGEEMSFYLSRDQYGDFLDKYLVSCETCEDYERCSDILELKEILSSR